MSNHPLSGRTRPIVAISPVEISRIPSTLPPESDRGTWLAFVLILYYPAVDLQIKSCCGGLWTMMAVWTADILAVRALADSIEQEERA